MLQVFSEVLMMVLPAKIFELKSEVNLETVVQQLRDFHEESVYETDNGEGLKLVTEVFEPSLKEGVVSGVFSKDFVNTRSFRRQTVQTPVTEEAPFWIKPFGKRAFLIVMAPSVARGVKKLLTNHVANKLSEVIFNQSWSIVEVRLDNETLKRLHETNVGASKLIWFDDVDIPSVQKLCLAGSGLADTKLYRDYLEHGKIWYVVFEVQKRGIVVGITRNCVVTLFSKSSTEDFVRYILEDLLMLIE